MLLITINNLNNKMTTEHPQGTYFQPSAQDSTRHRSSRKKAYKYTEDEYMLEPSVTDRYKPVENRYNPNDFSFEDRSKK